MLKAAGYGPNAGPIITVTGLFSLISAPFGALTTNLAAISAAICTGPDVHPDPAERWKTGPFYALAYLVFAAFGASLSRSSLSSAEPDRLAAGLDLDGAARECVVDSTEGRTRTNGGDGGLRDHGVADWSFSESVRRSRDCWPAWWCWGWNGEKR